MFIEPNLGQQPYGNRSRGWIEVITGCMFSGKTEELIRRVNRAVIAKQKVKLFKPSIDTRYHHLNVVSHNQNSIECTPLNSAKEILHLSSDTDVVGIDEVQFFDNEIVDVSNELANKGIRVIIAGLSMDSEARPFGFVPQLMSTAEFVTKLHAICAQCGGIASYSFRLSASKEKVLLGEKDLYEARCRECFNSIIS